MTLDGGVRRRGQALEDALLDAAWEELVEVGYSAFTFEGVAKRAETSRPVIYRRWATKRELVEAAIQHYRKTHPIETPDTGSLRGDVIAYLTDASAQRSEIIALLTAGLGGYFEETGTTFADLRRVFVGRAKPLMAEVMERAVVRGEADPARVTPRILGLPFDLLRHELLMTTKPVPRKVIEEIVDTIFLPLVTPQRPK